MTKTLQLKRGTKNANDSYTGAIAELTYDTESKELRVHDGVTQGGKVVGGLTSVSWNDITDKPTIPSTTSQLTNDSNFINTSEATTIANNSASNAVTNHNGNSNAHSNIITPIKNVIPSAATSSNQLADKKWVQSTLESFAGIIYKVKGSVATYNDLPQNAQPGDVYNVTDTGANYVYVDYADTDSSKSTDIGETVVNVSNQYALLSKFNEWGTTQNADITHLTLQKTSAEATTYTVKYYWMASDQEGEDPTEHSQTLNNISTNVLGNWGITISTFDATTVLAITHNKIGWDKLSETVTIEALLQKNPLPVASADELGNIYQYMGTTTASLTHGYMYQCNEHQIESSYTKEVISGSLSVDWIYVTLETFEETYSTTGDYTFSYDGSDWSIGGDTVDLGTLGIGIGGPTESGDSFTIHYVAAHTEYAWDTAQVSDLSSKQDVLTAGANITLDGSVISAAGYTEDLQYFGVRGNPNIWEFSTITMDMQRVNQITSGTLYKISGSSLVAYETLDTTTQFGTDMPRNANKTYVLFYGEDLISDLGETKNYIWVDKDNIYYGDTLEGSDEKMVWFETQYGGGYIKTAKYTNDSGTTWSTVSIPLISVKFDAESKLEKQNNYNVAMFGFEKMVMIQGTITFMLPAGKTSNGKYNYVIRTVSNFLNRLPSLPDDFTGYEVKAPWTTTLGDFTVDEENQCIFTDNSGTKYTDTSGNFIPYMYYYNGEPKGVPQNIVAIDNLQKQVDDLYEIKADKKEVEVVNSKVEAGIVSNPQTLEYTISGRSITFTGGYTWYPKNPNYSSGDGQVEVTERTGGMTVTIPVNDNNQYFLYDDTHDQDADNWCWNKWEKSSDTMIPDGEFCNRYSDIGYDWTIYKFVESTTGDEIYGTNVGGVYVGDAIYKVVELDSGYKCVVYLGHSTSVDNGAYTGYEDQDGVTHTGTWVRNSESLTKQAEDKDTLLSSRFHTWGGSDDPRTNCYWGYAADNSGSGNNTMGAIYWDGTKFVDQRSIIIIGNRITVCPGVRALMANGMNANEQAQYVDHTVDACIVDYIPYTLHDGDYEIVLTADDHIIWTQNATTDILTNTFYVDGVATIGCKIGTCHIEDIMMTSWTIDTPFRFVTREQFDNALAEKQDKLVSGTNIKTVNNVSLLGEGNIEIGGSGSTDWNDITNKPTSFTPSAHTHTVSEISNFPTLATVATSGDYDDLSNKPTIPAAQVQTDWNATTGMGVILNKPSTFTPSAHTHTVSDITDFPTIPTYSDFTGADGTNAGTHGLVPAPTATDNTKYLKGDGTWATVDSLPSQTGNNGKFLTTNGTSASWGNVSEVASQSTGTVKFWTGTQAQYDAITTKDATTLYIVIPA